MMVMLMLTMFRKTLMPYVGWVCCWFTHAPKVFFSGYSSFPLSVKKKKQKKTKQKYNLQFCNVGTNDNGNTNNNSNYNEGGNDNGNNSQ